MVRIPEENDKNSITSDNKFDFDSRDENITNSNTEKNEKK